MSDVKDPDKAMEFKRSFERIVNQYQLSLPTALSGPEKPEAVLLIRYALMTDAG